MSVGQTVPKGWILAVAQVEEHILSSILLIRFIESLLCVEERVVGEEINCLCVVKLQFLLDDHDKLKDSE